ncbi:ATP-dependent Clp protease adapter ClpS [Nesterenkonia muleiensis]|uniref:ATP-dependent Clp protease adapter ClpS n=1 Tax=Nesterenkonia muleiensis TaxID=2282648 RepID=UPI000E7143F6|nr:ATP-dependent Clp protease adapter ClpS [Nesterenkonia muleiensis]
MSSTAGSTLTHQETDLHLQGVINRPYQVVVWNDPVNLMSYVAWVFRSYFGHSKEKARELMLQVHHRGKAVVSSGAREKMERHVTAMHNYGLQATLEEAE